MKNLYNFLIAFGFIAIPSILAAQVTISTAGRLTIPNSQEIYMEGTGSKYIQFREGTANKGYVGHTGIDMLIQNDETNGIVEVDGQVGVELRVNNNTALDVDALGLVTIDKTGEALRLSGSSSYMTFYNGADYNGYVWHTNTNMYLYNNVATGNLYLGTGASGVDMTINSSGNVGIGTVSPTSSLEITKPSPAVKLSGAGRRAIDFNDGTSNVAWMSMIGTNLYINNTAGGFNYIGGSGDLQVMQTGNTGIGTTSPDEKLEVAGLIKSQGGTIQATGASATELVERTDGSAMLFGAGNNAGFTIDEAFAFHVRARPRSFLLSRSLSGGDYLMVSDGGSSNSAFGFSSAAAATHRLRVNGSVQATSYAIISDRKLKKDVNAFDVGLDAVKKINPVTYVYNGKAGIECDATQVGIMAQDLQKIAPVLVKEETYYEENAKTGKSEAKDTYLAINDTGIKYILVNAIKELAVEADAKDERIEDLEAQNEKLQANQDEMNERLNKLEALLTNSNTTVLDKLNNEKDVVLNGEGTVAELAQNQPNPFSENTTIKYFLTEGSTGAHMNIFNADGKMLKTVKIDEVGNGQINLKANSLPAGNYMYQLVTDAGVVGSKSMVLIK